MSYNIMQTVDEEMKREVTSAPDNWLVNDIFYWPDNKKKINQYRKSRKRPEIYWHIITNFKVLATNIPTYKEALEKEKEYEMYSDSESARNAQRRRAAKRLHPVTSVPSNNFDLNFLFGSISAGSVPDSKKKQKLSTDSLSDPPIGSNSNIKQSEIVKEAQTLDSNRNTNEEFSVILPINEDLGGRSIINFESKQGEKPKETLNILSVEIIKQADNTNSSHCNTSEDISMPLSMNGDRYELPLLTDDDLGEYLVTDSNQIFSATATNARLDNKSNSQVSNEVNSISNEVNQLRQNYQAQTSSEEAETTISLQMLAFDNKLGNLETKLDCVQSKLNHLEANQVVLKTQNDSVLKLLAAVHVKIDSIGNEANPTKSNATMTNEEIAQALATLTSKKIFTAEDMNAFERTITTKNDVRNALFQKLKPIGGRARKDGTGKGDNCTKRILFQLFEDDFLMNYTWLGTPKKDPFQFFNVNDLIKECVRVHVKDFTDKEYQDSVADHLKFASTRVQRRYL